LTIIFVGLIVFLAHLFVSLFERTHVPDVLYLILVGLLVGPILKLIAPEDFGRLGEILPTIALVVILFEGGLELGIDSLRASWRGSIRITFASYLIALVLLAAALRFVTDLPYATVLFIAAVLAGPAPSVIIPLVRQLRLRDSVRTTLTLESSLGEAVCIVVSLAVLELMARQEVVVGHLIGRLLSSFTFAIVLGALAGYGWSLLLDRVRGLQNAMFTTPSFVFILYGVVDFLGFSGPVSVLAFGITIGNANLIPIPRIAAMKQLKPLPHNEAELRFFGEIVFLVKTFFFVYIGIAISPSDFWSFGVGVLLTLVLIISRYIAVLVSAQRDGTSPREALVMVLSIPKGTAAAVLASIPLQLGLLDGEPIRNIIYAAVVISIVVTAMLVSVVPRIRAERFLRGYSGGEESG
jgi:NhaP-type Na+/H+ or K+/H+ antiporter